VNVWGIIPCKRLLSAFCSAAGLLFASQQAMATDIVLTDPVVWSNTGHGDPPRITTPNAAIVNPSNCNDTGRPPDSYFVASTLTQQAQSRLLAVLPSAKASGRSVSVRLSGCEQGRPAVVLAYF
jgi:hypothetical protein